MASDRLSLSFNLPSSLKAWRRFLWVDECAFVLKSQVLNLWILEFIDGSNWRPLESLFAFPITVARPMSWYAREVGDPTLDLSLLSESNVRHSARFSWSLSDDTSPHLLQAISPDSKSVTSWPLPHIQNTVEVCITMTEYEELEELASRFLRISDDIYVAQLYKEH